MMLGKDLFSYGDTDVLYRIGSDMQRLWRTKKEKDPSRVPFYHAWLPVYSWMTGTITTNLYQFNEHTEWMGTTNCSDKQMSTPLWLYLHH